ncbi:MFS transporter [Streptomyces yaizuensis]|uniref:MFS transporter n=1 Tax=Streptomyces yaizuensis TaxID=2989713 RepID=A0ABQ5P9H6_9ACTN|nr:MFS transporter [Streptomyces sp. YSPA8]GLF99143.1 MFS transporter [Streptomyces sp. YSPA8]
MAATPTAPPTGTGSVPAAGGRARTAGLRYGLLFGPAVFGISSAGVALPDVAAGLGSGASATAWVLTVHALALGIGTALFGRLADAHGIRTALLVGSAVLAAGAVVCLLAPGLPALVAGRGVLAAGSGALTACALALTATAAPAERPRILAAFGATLAVFTAAGTLAGGAVTAWLSWRVTLVLPAFSLLAVPLCLRAATRRNGSGRPLDALGAALLTLVAGGLLLLIQAPALGLPATAVAALATVLLLSAAGLALRVRTAETSFVPRALVTDGGFLRAAATGTGVYGGLFATMYAVPQILVREHGWSVLEIGAWLLPGAIAGSLCSRLAGRLPAATGGSRLLAATALACALALAAPALVPGAAGHALPLLLAASLGFAGTAVTQVVITALLSARVEPALRGGAMGLLNLGYFVGGGAGSATAGAVAASGSLTAALSAVALFPLTAAVTALTLGRPGGARRRT